MCNTYMYICHFKGPMALMAQLFVNNFICDLHVSLIHHIGCKESSEIGPIPTE